MSIMAGVLMIAVFGAEVPAKISYMVGEVHIERQGKTYSGVLKAPLYVNDIITTQAESQCEIQFSNYSLVLLEPHSSIKIERKEETPQGIFHRIFASIGNIVTKVTKLNTGDEYEVRTDAAQAFIRGTTFKTTIEEDGSSSFSVFEGSISVKSLLEGAKEYLLNEHFKSQIKMGEIAPVIDQLSELEINAFTTEFKDFLDRGRALEELKDKIEKEKQEKEEELKKKKDEGLDKLKGIFK